VPRKKNVSDAIGQETLRSAMEQKKATLDTMKLAYFHRAPFGGSVPDEGSLKRTAEEFIAANYAYQRALFGRVRVKLSAANLLR
jgi:hypothetical protein